MPTLGSNLSGSSVVILATHGFEQSELEVPRDRLKAAGVAVDVVAPEDGQIRGWDKSDWGHNVDVDKTIDQVRADDYDAIILAGGQINPDHLRANPKAVALIRTFFDQNKIVAAVCHAPWLLIEADIVKGRKVTSYHSIKTDLVNAGAHWEDSAVVFDYGLITSRNPGDLDAFSGRILKELSDGRHSKHHAA
jgi:protease I